MNVLDRDIAQVKYLTNTSTLDWGGFKVGGAMGMPLTGLPEKKFIRPLLGLEIHDDSSEFPSVLTEAMGSLEIVAQLEKAQSTSGCNFLAIFMRSTNEKWFSKAIENVKLPIIVYAFGVGENDPARLNSIAEAMSCRGGFLGVAEEETYRTVVAAAMAHNLGVVARSPMDFNMAKQLTILISEMGMETGRILVDPLPSSLGYGLQYTYSVSERLRLAGLSGDAWCGLPLLGAAGEAWAGRECWGGNATRLGDPKERAPRWEATTALAMIASGASVVHMRHPVTFEMVKSFLDEYEGRE